MKKINAVIFLLLLTVLLSCGGEQKKTTTENKQETNKNEATGDKVVKDEVIVDFDLQGLLTGKMQIRRSGNKMKQVINSEMYGVPNKSEVYVLNNTVYTVTEVRGKKFANKINLEDYNKQKQTGETIVDFAEFEKFLAGKNVTGSENILGYNTDIYDMGNGVVLNVFNKKYIMKIKTPQLLATATRVDPNPEFAANEFELPTDVTFTTTTPQDFGKEKIDSLKKELTK